MIPLPWRVRILAEKIVSAYHYALNRHFANNPAKARAESGKTKILFCVPFYGYTGGAFAVLSAANLLAESCEVSFLTKPTNSMNRYVSPKVRMVDAVAGPYDFCVIESGIGEAIVSQVKRDGAVIILTIHGAPETSDGALNYGYSDEQIAKAFKAADSIQYVSDVQLPFFDAIPAFPRRKIPNYVLPFEKTANGRA